ncbi:hypothetical protein [Streptosporangium sp. NPDC002721]
MARDTPGATWPVTPSIHSTGTGHDADPRASRVPAIPVPTRDG